ncbi:ATP-dependent helicase, partial [Sulfurovum sp. bin170]
MLKAMPGNVDAEVINQVLIPKIIKIKYPELDDEEVESLRQFVVVDSVVKNGEIKEEGDKKFIKMADKFVNIDELHIDLIDTINPFQKAFEILSKSVTTGVLKLIQESIEFTRITMTQEEALILYPKIAKFKQERHRLPDINALDALEKRMAEALIFLNNLRRERKNG